MDYLCDSVNRWFAPQVAPGDVAWTYAGVRPLYDDAATDASAVTRDYVLDLETPGGGTPVLSAFGGKITTYRRLAEHAMEKLGPYLPPHGPTWTAQCALPGGDFDRFLAVFRRRCSFLPDALSSRLARAYGSRAEMLLCNARNLGDLGENLGGGLTEAEASYLVGEEWARTADDILWRRSKLGLHVPQGTAGRVSAYLERQALPAGTP